MMIPLTAGPAQVAGPDSVRAYSPADLRAFTAHLPDTFDPATIKPAWQAYACWVVSAVVIRRYLDRGSDEETYVPLHHEYVEGHVPKKVRKDLLAELVKNGVLECDGIYYFGSPAGQAAGRHVPGQRGKCLCYRLGAAHRQSGIRPLTLTHHELLRKMNRFNQQERDTITDPVHCALRDWHDRVEVLPDAPYGEHPLLDRMIDGERRFSVCTQGRVHTNVANLPRQYRKFLRVAGQELMSCDISTSQPLLLAILLQKMEKEHKSKRGTNHSAVYAPSSHRSLSAFLRDCLGGTVYDRVADLTGYTRDDVKSMFLAVVYGHPNDMHTRVGRAIRSLYPAVFDAVVEMNFMLGHGELPRRLQTLESGVMIRRVAARLLREHPEMPLLTVHDCIVAPEGYEAVVAATIAEEWMAEFGVLPGIKTTSFTAPQERRVAKRRRRASKWRPQPLAQAS